VLDYVKRHLLQPDGDFLPRGDPWYIDVHYQYALAWSFTDYMLNTEKGKALLKTVCRLAYKGKKDARIPEPMLKSHAEKWKEYVSGP